MDELLQLLEDNARVPLVDLARLTGKKTKDVAKAVKEYEKKGVIVKYKTVINHAKVKGNNKNVLALIEVKVTPQKDVGFDHSAERIFKFPEVKSCYLLSGSYDLLLMVEGKDIQTVAGFVSEKLAPLEAVKGTTTHFLLKKYKEDGVILNEKEKSSRLAITF